MSKETEFLKNFYELQDKATASAAKKQQKKEYKNVKHLGKAPQLDANMPSTSKGDSKEEVLKAIEEKFKGKPMRDTSNNGLEQE